MPTNREHCTTERGSPTTVGEEIIETMRLGIGAKSIYSISVLAHLTGFCPNIINVFYNPDK